VGEGGAVFRSKKELEIFVESLPTFRRPKLRLEQYPTDAAVVAAAVWDAHMRGLLEAAIDLGCGTGRFALAAAAMGARRVLCVDVDVDALEVAKEATAARGLHAVDFLAADAPTLALRRKFAVAFQNPPFGIWSGRGTDVAFLAVCREARRRGLHHPQAPHASIRQGGRAGRNSLDPAVDAASETRPAPLRENTASPAVRRKAPKASLT
jgi:predicted RNA methylase